MALFTRAMFCSDGDEAGVRIDDLGRALVTAIESIKFDEDTGRPMRTFTIDLTKT